MCRRTRLQCILRLVSALALLDVTITTAFDPKSEHRTHVAAFGRRQGMQQHLEDAADHPAGVQRGDERVLPTLRSGAVSEVRYNGLTPCLFKVVLKAGGDAVSALLRLEEHVEARGEMLAHEMDRWFGFDRSPATVWRCFNLRAPSQGTVKLREDIAAHCPAFKGNVACGAVQQVVSGLRGDEAGKDCTPLEEALCPACSTLPHEELQHAQQELALLAAFDFLVGNLDRSLLHPRMLYLCEGQKRCDEFHALRVGMMHPHKRDTGGQEPGEARALLNEMLRGRSRSIHRTPQPHINNLFCELEPVWNLFRVLFVDSGRNLLAGATKTQRARTLWANGAAPALGAASPAGMCCDVAVSSSTRKQLQRFVGLSTAEQHTALGWTRARKANPRWQWGDVQAELTNFTVRRVKHLEKCMRLCAPTPKAPANERAHSDWQRPFLESMPADRLGRKVIEGTERYRGCKHTAFSATCRDGVLMGPAQSSGLQAVRNFQACAALCRKTPDCVAFSYYQHMERCLLWSGNCSHEQLGPIDAVRDMDVADDPVTCWISSSAADDTKPMGASHSDHYKVDAAFWKRIGRADNWFGN